MERLYNWLLLKAIKGLGEVSIKRLWLRFGKAESILSGSYEDIRELLGEEKTRAFFKKELSFDPEEVIRLVEREKIQWLTLEDQEYPALLKEIDDPPPVLFLTGALKNTSLIAIVGTRKPDTQSLWFISKLVRELVQRGYGVSSGGAIGCDYHSHRECLQAGGFSVCFLGMGILNIPHYLQKLRGENMVFVSEFLPDAPPEEFTFPRRNRLISAISKAVVVAEAGQKSGALITADYAVKQKKPLWVYIGNSASQRWLGCVNLVNSGKAKIIHSPLDLFEGIPNANLQKDPLLDLLSTPKTFDELLLLTGLGYSELSVKLSNLEVQGKVARQGNFYMAL